MRAATMKLRGDDEPKPITVGNDALAGRRVMIMPVVRAGNDGSVVVTGAVVTQDIADFSIGAGVPVKVVKSRTRMLPKARLLNKLIHILDKMVGASCGDR